MTTLGNGTAKLSSTSAKLKLLRPVFDLRKATMAKKQSPEQAKLALYEALVANVLPDFDLDKAIEANDFTVSLDGETILYRPQTAASEAPTAPASAESDESSTSEAQTEPAGDHDGKEQDTQTSEAAPSGTLAASATSAQESKPAPGGQALDNITSILAGRKSGSAPSTSAKPKPDIDKLSDEDFDKYLVSEASAG